MNTPEVNETIKLSLIYSELLVDIEAVANVGIPVSDRQQAMQIISDAVGRALILLNNRCPVCDSEKITIYCEDCATEKDAKELHEELRQRGLMQ